MPDTLNDPIKSRLNIELPTQIRSMLQYKNLIKQRTFTSHFTQLSQTILQPSRTACITNKLTVQWDIDIEWVWTKHKLKWIKSIQTRVLNALHVGIDKRDSVLWLNFSVPSTCWKCSLHFFSEANIRRAGWPREYRNSAREANNYIISTKGSEILHGNKMGNSMHIQDWGSGGQYIYIFAPINCLACQWYVLRIQCETMWPNDVLFA